MTTNYLLEAFSALRLVEEEFPIDSAHGLDDFKKSIEDDVDEEPVMDVIDPEALHQEDLQSSYAGKVILECPACHTRIYKDAEEVIIDEDSQMANIEEHCPVCSGDFGFTIIGKIEPFEADVEDDIPAEEEDEEEVEIPEEDDFSDEEVEEALKSVRKKAPSFADDDLLDEASNSQKLRAAAAKLSRLGEGKQCPHCGKDPCECDDLHEEMLEHGNDQIDPVDDIASEDAVSLEDNQEELVHEPGEKIASLTEDIENVQVTADGQSFNVNQDPEGNVSVSVNHVVEPVSGEETMVPLEDAEVAAIEDQSSEDDIPVEDEPAEEMPAEEVPTEEEIPEEVPEEEVFDGEESLHEEKHEYQCDNCGHYVVMSDDEYDGSCPKCHEHHGEFHKLEESYSFENINDFDEAKFAGLCESFMQRVYGNAKSFKVSAINLNEGKLTVDGNITFNSGKTRSTSFVFESVCKTKRGALVMEGYNKTFAAAPKAFRVKGSFKKNAFVAESMIYNFTSNSLNESKERKSTRVYGRVKSK